jgi:hypothetical protein
MIDFTEITIRIKQIIAFELQKEKILDKDVAISLQINPQNYAVIKRRKSIPFEAIAHFSKKNQLNMLWILFGDTPQYLTKE